MLIMSGGVPTSLIGSEHMHDYFILFFILFWGEWRSCLCMFAWGWGGGVVGWGVGWTMGVVVNNYMVRTIKPFA